MGLSLLIEKPIFFMGVVLMTCILFTNAYSGFLKPKGCALFTFIAIRVRKIIDIFVLDSS